MQIKVNDKLYPAEKTFGVVRFKGNPLVRTATSESQYTYFNWDNDEELLEFCILRGCSVDAMNDRFPDINFEVVE